jgi:hypothetical protein
MFFPGYLYIWSFEKIFHKAASSVVLVFYYEVELKLAYGANGKV